MPNPSRTPRVVAATLVATTALLVALVAAAPASAAPTWAPADQATVHPGVQTDTAGGQCTANFVFTAGTDVFIGQAAHCSGTGGQTETNGCDSGSLPLGTEVTVSGADHPGTMVYNSWLAMQAAGETDDETCQYNDLALIRLDPADHAKVNPSIPTYGGPVGLGTSSEEGETVYSYGNSSLRGGVAVLSPKTGISLGQTPGGWSHTVYTMSPGIPGDSGSAFLDSEGNAIGVLSTLAIAPLAGSNGVSDLSRMLEYARTHGGPAGLTLATGTEPFSPSLMGLLPFG